LVIDTMKILYTYGNIEVYVLVTGDRDFIPLVNAIRQHGKKVIVIGIAEAASSHLAQSADEFFFYHQLSEDIRKKAEKPEDPYDALVQAVRVARERGNMPTFATLKLLMVESMGDFDQTKYKDSQGRPFTKFKDFAREAARRGLVQIFSSGTANEVFLPDEDPEKVSSLAELSSSPSLPGQTGEIDLDTLFDILVEATKLARRRKNACTAGTIKLIMKEMLGSFHESDYSNHQGKPFRKFRDFLKEAERHKKVQILSSGTVDEIFLPGENPRELSRFADLSDAADQNAGKQASQSPASSGQNKPKSRRKKAQTRNKADA